MAKIILTEEQFKQYVKMLYEEEYAMNIPVRTFSNEDEAKQFLSYLRKKYGFSQHDSYLNGTTVVVSVEKSTTDDSYFHDIVNAIRAEGGNGEYRRVSEALNESFSSRKLAQLAKQHGGIDVSRNGGIRSFVKAWQYGNGVDLSTITDDMLVGEPFVYDWPNITSSQKNNAILFNDGYAVEISKDADTKKPVSGERKLNRYGTGIGDTGDHDKRESPFFKDGKRDVGPQYNGFGTSAKSGESQNLRNAMKNNLEDLEYYNSHPEDYRSKENARHSQQNIDTIRKYARELLGKK